MHKINFNQTVKNYLIKNNLGYAKFEIRYDYDDYATIDAHVKREDYNNALFLDYYDELPNCSIQWQQITPPLVPAKLGDLVLIYNQYEANDEYSDIGVVTIIKNTNPPLYGCSYFRTTINNQFVSQTNDFELSNSDYGGWHEGFLKILTKEEFKARVIKQIEEGHKKEIESMNFRKERSIKYLDQVVDSLADSENTTFQELYFKELHHSIENKQND